jgi:acyl-CoA hydrolase
MDHLTSLHLNAGAAPKTDSARMNRQPSLFSMRASQLDLKGGGSFHTIVSLQQPVLTSHIDETGRLRCAELLKSMDICACMSAERHCHTSSVTLSMDDVNFSDARVKVGDVVVIRSRVNRVWTTSMEVGLRVEVEFPESGETRHVCSSYFVFVALDKEGRKMNVPPLVPVSEREKIRYALSGDRRQIRLDRAQIVDKAAAERSRLSVTGKPLSQQTMAGGGGGGRELAPTLSGIASMQSLSTAARYEAEDDKNVITQMVLPQHANHYGGTFGGQIMAWSHEAAQVAAARHARCAVVTVSVDDVNFLAGSKVGTRVMLKASVNRVFSKSMEVGVRVEGHHLDGEVVLLTRAYFTLVAVDPLKDAAVLGRAALPAALRGSTAGSAATAAPNAPALQSTKSKKSLLGRARPSAAGPASAAAAGAPGPGALLEKKGSAVVRQAVLNSEDQKRRYAKAAGRRRVRLERLALRQSNHLAWPFSPDTDPRAMILENLVALDRSARADADAEWSQVETKDGVTVWSKQDMGGVTLKSEYEMPGASFGAVIAAVSDVALRGKWDTSVAHHQVRHEFPGLGADVVWLAVDTRAVDAKAKPTDFALLRSWKRDGDTYVIASHSVVHNSVPGDKAYVRAEVASSGFFLQDLGKGEGVRVVYLLQLSPQGTSIVAGEVVGTSKIAVARMLALAGLVGQMKSAGNASDGHGGGGGNGGGNSSECAVM